MLVIVVGTVDPKNNKHKVEHKPKNMITTHFMTFSLFLCIFHYLI